MDYRQWERTIIPLQEKLKAAFTLLVVAIVVAALVIAVNFVVFFTNGPWVFFPTVLQWGLDWNPDALLYICFSSLLGCLFLLVTSYLLVGWLSVSRQGQSSLKRRKVLRGIANGTALLFIDGVMASIGCDVLWWREEHRRATKFVYDTNSRSIWYSVTAVAWSPDGKRIASTGNDLTFQVCNAADGGDVFIYKGNAGGGDSNMYSTNAIAWSPDGKWVAFDISGSLPSDTAGMPLASTVHVWNAADGADVFTYKGHTDSVKAIAWSPDGERIASGSSDSTVQVWNARDGNNIFTYRGHSNSVTDVAWSPDGKHIASGSADGTVQVWNAADGGDVFTYDKSENGAQSHGVNAVAWSPDGKRIASGGDDNRISVWSAANGCTLYTFYGHSQTVLSIAWSSDGKWIASGGDQIVQVWNATDDSPTFAYIEYSEGVVGVALSPNGKQVAVASRYGTVTVWNVYL